MSWGSTGHSLERSSQRQGCRFFAHKSRSRWVELTGIYVHSMGTKKLAQNYATPWRVCHTTYEYHVSAIIELSYDLLTIRNMAKPCAQRSPGMLWVGPMTEFNFGEHYVNYRPDLEASEAAAQMEVARVRGHRALGSDPSDTVPV